MRVRSLHGAGQPLETSHWPALKELRVPCPASSPSSDEAWLSVHCLNQPRPGMTREQTGLTEHMWIGVESDSDRMTPKVRWGCTALCQEASASLSQMACNKHSHLLDDL